MKIALVDDERIYLDEMQKLCLEFAAQHTIQPEIFRFSSSEDFLKSWQPGFYSIIFLDIFMKNGNGIETAQKLREGNDNSLLVFLTSSSDFMPDAFSCHAFDYILKPISYFSFSESMVRALAKVKAPEKEYITIVLKGGKKKLDVARICYVEVQDHVLIYHTLDGDFETKGTMRDTDNQFDPRKYFRCNRCYLVNLEFVETYQGSDIMVNGDTIQVSRSRRKPFLDALNEYMNEVGK